MVLAALLAGCGERAVPEAAAPAAPAAPAAAAPKADPAALIGLWTVADSGEGKGTILRIAASGPYGGLLVFGPCGDVLTSWRANADGDFVAGRGDGAMCPAVAWLDRAVAFRVTGGGPVLLDAEGGQVARLVPGARPRPVPGLLASAVEQPVVDAEARRVLAPAAPLPPSLRPVPRAALVGRWAVDDGVNRRTTPYVELRADGAWQGSDGCNGQAGRWVAGAAGAFLATQAFSTLIGCDNVRVGDWLAWATRAGLDGEALVLLGAEGQELGRLKRS